MTLRKKPVNRRKKNVESYREQAIQIAVVEYLDMALPRDALRWSTRNEGKRSTVELAFAVRAGLWPGMPDLCIFWRGQLFMIEMKAKPPGAKPTKHEVAQGYPQERLRAAGAHVAVCWTVDMVERFLRDHGVPLRATVLPSGAVQKEIAE